MDPRSVYLQTHDIDSLLKGYLEALVTIQPDNPRQLLLDYLEGNEELSLCDAKTLLKANSKISKEIDPTEAAQVVIEVGCSLLRCERASVFIHDATTKTLRLVVGRGTKGLEIRDDVGIAGDVIQTGQIVNVIDAYADARFNRSVDEKTGYKTRTILGVPIKDAQDLSIGVLLALNKQQNSFSLRDQAIAKHLATSAGVTIRNAQLHADAAYKERRSKALVSFIRSISQEMAVQSLAVQVTSNATELFQVRTCSLFVVDYDNLNLIPLGTDIAHTTKLNDSLLGKVALTGEVTKFSQGEGHKLACLETALGYRPQSCLAAPIYDSAKQSIIGVIQLSDKKQAAMYGELSLYIPFTEEDVDFLKHFSDLIGKRLEHAFRNIIRLQSPPEEASSQPNSRDEAGTNE
jgi:adenylate cyclase